MTGIDVQARATAVAIDYRHPATMYLMTSEGIYRREGGQAWAFVHTLKALALAVDMLDSNTLWAGVPYSTEYDAIVLKSDDRGRTWGRADDGMFSGPGAGVSAIVIDPADPNIFFANVRYAGRFGWPLGDLVSRRTRRSLGTTRRWPTMGIRLFALRPGFRSRPETALRGMRRLLL